VLLSRPCFALTRLFVRSWFIRSARAARVLNSRSFLVSNGPLRYRYAFALLLRPPNAVRYAQQNEKRLPSSWSAAKKQSAARAIGILAPKAVGVRTIQIVGTFVILNGLIYLTKDYSPF
jgi:hypothetical protein